MECLKLHDPERVPSTRPPLVTDDPTVAQIIDWHEGNAARFLGSQEAETERRRIWALFRAKFGALPVRACRPFQILDFINSQPGITSDWTRKRWNVTIQSPFNAAEKLGLIPRNTFRGHTYRQGPIGRDWTDEEYSAMLRGSTAVFRRVLVWTRFSGMRPGESRKLRNQDIRIADGKILIENHKTHYITKAPRAIPISRVLGKLLAWAKVHNPPGTQHVLLNAIQRPWSTQSLTKRVRRMRRKLGLSDAVKLHGGRHTFATRTLMNGVEQAALMELLGHRQLATLQRYVHLAGKVDHLAEAMERAVTRKRPAIAAAPDRVTGSETPLFDLLR